MAVVSGRLPTVADSAAFLVNETAVARFGWADPLGKAIRQPTFDGTGGAGEVLGRVVGVVRDFHYGSLHTPIEPGVFFTAWWPQRHLLVRAEPGAAADVLRRVEARWPAWAPDQPFTYTFLDESYDALYRSEQRLATLVGLFALLAAFVAGLGLVGLTAHALERRTKEIGIRKVLGASGLGLVGLLTRDLLRPLGGAFLVAAPVAYLAVEAWLADYAYRIAPGPGLFLLAGLAAVMVVLVAVGYHTWRAATADPVRALRWE